MAHYLPVLLVSVTSNPSITSVPDDLSLETLPRGQVDYLSHDWEEEDVWRSWRNMTRQKNEIANGIRLENASWRTWWKQRNKLKTVTPETLNWLKDSDVTWLYGPLHTAVDWTPPPKPKPAPTSVDKAVPSSAVDRLDLTIARRNTEANVNRSANETKHKSILKYRSISELLMNDLPPSVMASPRFGMSPSASDDESDLKPTQGKSHSRPPLTHTKSEGHVATLVSPGKQALAAMGLRKDSPPRIDPPGKAQDNESPSPPLIAGNLSGDSSDLASATSPSTSPVQADDTNPAPSGRQRRKHKHIAFNTFVEQCIAIDKPQAPSRPRSSKKRTKSIPGLGYETSGNWNGKTRGMRWDGVEDDDDEEFLDDEDDFYHSSDSSSEGEDVLQVSPDIYPHLPSSWYSGECAIGSSDESDGHHDESVFDDDDDEDPEDEDQGILEMRPSRHTLLKPKNSRSQSKVSTSSSSSASTTNSGISNNSTDETSPSPARDDTSSATPHHHSDRRSPPTQPHHRLSNSSQSSNTTIMARRKSFSFPRRRPSRRKNSSNPSHNHPLTIAPIAPTVLKTTGVGGAWDGFGSGYGYEHTPYSNGGWIDGFGDDGYSDDGGVQKWYDGAETIRMPRSGDSNSSSDIGTPVELVYVPPIGRYGGVTTPSPKDAAQHEEGDTSAEVERVYHHQKSFFSTEDNPNGRSSMPVPIVVRTPAPPREEKGEDAYDYFSGPDLGASRKKKSSRESSQSSAADTRDETNSEERLSRSRSRSRSRTPSPNLAPAASTQSSSPPSSALLSPTLRGRSFQQQPEPVVRGRSSTRTSSSSLSDRDRSSHSSPLGSLSPDGIASSAYGAYANGRIDRDRDREKDKRKGKERGRERTERRLNHSVSLDDVASTSATPTSDPTRGCQQAVPAEHLSPPTSPNPLPIPIESSPPNPKDGDGTIVGRAVGIVSSAGAYFGLWDERT